MNVFGVQKKLYKLSKFGGRAGVYNLDKIQKNSNFFSWNLPQASASFIKQSSNGIWHKWLAVFFFWIVTSFNAIAIGKQLGGCCTRIFLALIVCVMEVYTFDQLWNNKEEYFQYYLLFSCQLWQSLKSPVICPESRFSFCSLNKCQNKTQPLAANLEGDWTKTQSWQQRSQSNQDHFILTLLSDLNLKFV